jgi:hypothetical protein
MTMFVGVLFLVVLLVIVASAMFIGWHWIMYERLPAFLERIVVGSDSPDDSSNK